MSRTNLKRRVGLSRKRKAKKYIYMIAPIFICCLLVLGIYKIRDSGNGKDKEQIAITASTIADTIQVDVQEKESPEEQQPESIQEQEQEVEQEKIYIVQAGDNLSMISQKFYGDSTKYKLIMERNGIVNPGSLKIGQQLIIPLN